MSTTPHYSTVGEVPLEQMNKLPAWAKNLLRTMDQQMEQLERRCDRMERRLSDANIFISSYPKDIPLAKDEHIRFRMGDGREQYIDVHVSNGQLTVHAGETMAVHPRASNLVVIGLENRLANIRAQVRQQAQT